MSQCTVKDYEVVMKFLCRKKKPLVKLHQKRKERTPCAVDEIAGPTPDNTCDDGMDEMMMEVTKIFDTDEGFVHPYAVDEVAGPAPNNMHEEGMDEMMMEMTNLLHTNEGFVPFQSI